eukprot:TRINITY_DN57307_c0_g1_i1.p1 TRINITY_DN57307_c0_g1~~TRINITY_DN57307_c0_g1_i1.p1  ORF type:complete len:742 (+),score=96.11 TRINITY_DN57307_c0_g1_i1:26-2227(+)
MGVNVGASKSSSSHSSYVSRSSQRQRKHGATDERSDTDSENSPSPRKDFATGAFSSLWVAAEIASIVMLSASLIRLEALFGRSEEQLRNGILPMEQITWNLQKCLRCALIVLCFSNALKMELPDRERFGPPQVFALMARELFLLDRPGAKQRRRKICFLLIASIRVLLGTIRNFLSFRESNKKGSTDICSASFYGGLFLILDVAANSGFLIGFYAGRKYFIETAIYRDAEDDLLCPVKEYCLDDECSLFRTKKPWAENICRPPQQGTTCVDITDGIAEMLEARRNGCHKPECIENDRNGKATSKEVNGKARKLTSAQGEQTEEEAEKKRQLCDFGWTELEHFFEAHGPIFRSYAKIALIAICIACVMECYFLQHWEAGILGAREDEVDVFQVHSRYFVSYTPDFSRWHWKRIVVGSWRDIIYAVLIHPMPCTLIFTVGSCAYMLGGALRLQAVRTFILRLCLGMLIYMVLVSAHRAYFALICLFICWECRWLETKALNLARLFSQLSPTHRWEWHVELGDEIKALDMRLEYLISYVFLQRLAYLIKDLLRQSCESALPFNIVHYLFRHVMFIGTLSLTLWRVGKLNFAQYERLTNAVMDLYPHNWAALGVNPNVTQNDVQLQRWSLDDWRFYLMHNIDSGRREACIRVLQLRWAAKSHVLALSIIGIVTFPLLNKIMDTYGRHVLNDRLLNGSISPDFPSGLQNVTELDGVCAASREPWWHDMNRSDSIEASS